MKQPVMVNMSGGGHMGCACGKHADGEHADGANERAHAVQHARRLLAEPGHERLGINRIGEMILSPTLTVPAANDYDKQVANPPLSDLKRRTVELELQALEAVAGDSASSASARKTAAAKIPSLKKLLGLGGGSEGAMAPASADRYNRG